MQHDKRNSTDPSSEPTARRIAAAEALPADVYNPFKAPKRRGPMQSGYRMVPAPGAASPVDCEVEAEGVTLQVRWGDNTLAVHHLDQGQSFHAGEGEADDLQVPESVLGQRRLPLVLDGCAVIPAEATGTVNDGDREMRLDEVIAMGITRPCADAAGAVMLPLGAGMSVTLRLGDLTIELRGEKKGRRMKAFTLAALTSGALGYVAASFVAHAGVLGAMAMVMPPTSDAGDDGLSDDQRYYIQQMLDVNAEPEMEAQEATNEAEESDQGAEQGERSGGDEGAAGSQVSDRTNGRIAIKDRGPEKAVAHTRAELMQDAGTFGLINVLSGFEGPQSDLGEDFASGLDGVDANGTLWGDSPGEAFGPGGLGLTGIGEGGGPGNGKAYGLGPIGTIGNGFCQGAKCGGFRPARFRHMTHKAKAPTVRTPAPSSVGVIPPEVIQRIVRQNYGRFRACYESGLRNNPNLAGRVQVNFVIGRDGAVSNVGGGGDLPDSAVVSCVTRSFGGLTFPPPEHGIVAVSYPIVFSPGN